MDVDAGAAEGAVHIERRQPAADRDAVPLQAQPRGPVVAVPDPPRVESRAGRSAAGAPPPRGRSPDPSGLRSAQRRRPGRVAVLEHREGGIRATLGTWMTRAHGAGRAAVRAAAGGACLARRADRERVRVARQQPFREPQGLTAHGRQFAALEGEAMRAVDEPAGGHRPEGGPDGQAGPQGVRMNDVRPDRRDPATNRRSHRHHPGRQHPEAREPRLVIRCPL